MGLKNIVARPRPCWLESIDLLVKNPRDYSFPSGHTWSAVAGAWVATAANRRFGYAAIPLAAALAFSRLSVIAGGVLFSGKPVMIHFFTKKVLCNRRKMR